MSSTPFRIIVKSFQNSKGLENLKSLRSISTHCNMFKDQIAVLDDRCRLPEVDTLQFEISSLSWLHQAAPGFPVNGSKITIIEEPSEFYSTLLEKCKTAENRIVLSSLYIGNGKLENKLIDTIEETLDANDGNVKISILIDYMRGSRGKQNSRKLLQSSLNGKWKNCWNVFLYHTPKLRGVLKRVTPDRYNEMIGLQHMKLYLFDDTLIISGANLSNDYFTNRQDRYFMIEDCKELCDFYSELVEKVGEFSFRLMPDGSAVPSSVECNPLKSPAKQFNESAAGKIRSLFQTEIIKRSEINKQVESIETDTWIFPLIQMSQLDIWHDSEVTLRLLQTAPSGATLRLATGYFNLTTEYRNALLADCRAVCHLLTAHPTANGFFGAKGITGGIPAAYTEIEEKFCKLSEKLQQAERITLWEFRRPGWTYHAKGLWYTLPNQQKPSLTLIGSPNFGYRSVMRDLETQIAVVTKNEKLQNSLQREYERLFQLATPVNSKSFRQDDRIPPAWVRAVVLLCRYYF